MRRSYRVFWVILICRVLLLADLTTAQNNPKLMILHSYHRGFDWSDTEETGFLDRFREVYPAIDIPIEFLDAKRCSDGKNLTRVKDFLADKYRGRKIDVIVAFDNPALDMLMRYHNEFLTDVPVVFAGISDFEQSMLTGRKRVTGVAEIQDVKNTLELALSLHPRTREILVISDQTISGLSSRRDMESLIPSYQDRVSIHFMPPATFTEAETNMNLLHSDALVLLLSFYTDRLGRSLSVAESTRVFTEAAKVPVYGVHETRLGYGIVGGYLLGGKDHGRRAADIALRVVAGENPEAIPVDTNGTARPMFDNVQLQRFGISRDKLPAESLVINQPDSFFDTHMELVLGTLLVLFLLIAMVIILIASILRRKRAEAWLRKTERIVSTSQDLMALIGRGGVYETVNERFLTVHNLQREAVVGRTVSDIFGQDVFLEKIKPRLEQALSGQTVSYQEWFVFAGIGRRFMEVNYFPMVNKGGNVEGVVLNARDITESRKLEEHLMQSQKIESIGTLAGGVAHEINNPINGIMNYAQLILDGMEPKNPSAEYAREILHETRRIAGIVRNLLTFARHEKQSHSPARLSDIVSSVLSLIQTVMRHDQIILEVDIPDDLPGIKCRTQQIQQVLMNLLTNARDALNGRYPGYSPEKKLRVSASVIQKNGRNFIRTTVEDRGTGIAPEIRDRIFDPFFTTKPKETGTGLGLSISYGIIRDHGGELSMESDPGCRTRFYMDLSVDNGWSLSEK